MNSRSNKILFASWIGIIGNAILAITKILIGWSSHSLAVIGDGIDSSSDVATFVITLFAARIIAKPPDNRFPYGYNRADTLATTFLAFLIMFVGVQLFISSISKIIAPEELEIPSNMAIYVTLFSIVGKIVLLFWQLKIAKITKSTMLKANAINMRNDIFISLTVLIGLFFTLLFDLPLIDPIIAIGVSLWVFLTSIKILKEINTELMDGVGDTDIYYIIINSVEKVNGAENPHRIRVRKNSGLFIIGLDIEVEANMSVENAHNISHLIENNIRKNVDNIFDIVIHIEPKGRGESTVEPFGVNRKNVDKNAPINKDLIKWTKKKIH